MNLITGCYKQRNFHVSFDNVIPCHSLTHVQAVYAYSGIYANISNKTSLYVGSTEDLYNRFNYEHLNDLKNNNHNNKHLQKAWNKYGAENFQIIILENGESLTRFQLREREQNWLDYYNYSFKHKVLFNIVEEVGLLPQLTDEQRKRRSINWGGSKNPMYNSQRFGKLNPFFAKKHTEITRRSISEKAKIRFCNQPGTFSGKKHSEQAKAKMRVAAQNRIPTLKQLEALARGRKNNIYDYMKISVQQIDKYGVTVDIYFSISDASKATGIDETSISRCANGKKSKRKNGSFSQNLTAGGYRWILTNKESARIWDIIKKNNKNIFNNC